MPCVYVYNVHSPETAVLFQLDGQIPGGIITFPNVKLGTTHLVQEVGGINLFVLISAVSLLYCAPLAVFMEGLKWGGALQAAQLGVGTQVSDSSQSVTSHLVSWRQAALLQVSD